MENKNSNSTLDEININPKTKIAKEKHNLIPIKLIFDLLKTLLHQLRSQGIHGVQSSFHV